MSLSRRRVLAGLIAAPAVVAVDRLMPLRGIVMGHEMTASAVLARVPVYEPPLYAVLSPRLYDQLMKMTDADRRRQTGAIQLVRRST